MITIDGITYNVPVLSIKRNAEFLDKYAERTADGVLRREILGVYYNYQIQFGRTLDTVAYAALWTKLTEPTEFHTVVVPDESGDFTFVAYFSGVSDELIKKSATKNFWKNLSVNFIAKEPALT